MIFRGLIMVGVLALAGCAAASQASTGSSPVASMGSSSADSTDSSSADSADSSPAVSTQVTELVASEELVVLHTNMGDIKLQLYPEEAPKAVENFTTHAKNGYYDGVIFHRVMEGFMIQGGDPEGTGMGGESIWGGGFGYEKSDKLRHYRGALAMAHSAQPESNGSQFYIVQNNELDPGMADQLEQLRKSQDELLGQDENGNDVYARDMFPEAVIDKYLEVGGTPHLDLAANPDGHTVFGQVVEGMDVVDAIAAVETDENDKPVEDVIIESISFEAAK